MNWQLTLILACVAVGLGADLLARIHDRRWDRHRGRSRSSDDYRDWHGIFMKDVK